MILQLVLVLGTILVAVMAAVAMAHTVRWPSRRGSSGAPIVMVQRTVRRYGVLLAVVEAAALIALLIALFMVAPGSREMWLVGIAALSVAAMIGVWAAWLRPLNVTIGAWPPDTPPADWSRHHRRWTLYHRVRVLLAIIALALLLMGLFARPAH